MRAHLKKEKSAAGWEAFQRGGRGKRSRAGRRDKELAEELLRRRKKIGGSYSRNFKAGGGKKGDRRQRNGRKEKKKN